MFIIPTSKHHMLSVPPQEFISSFSLAEHPSLGVWCSAKCVFWVCRKWFLGNTKRRTCRYPGLKQPVLYWNYPKIPILPARLASNSIRYIGKAAET